MTSSPTVLISESRRPVATFTTASPPGSVAPSVAAALAACGCSAAFAADSSPVALAVNATAAAAGAADCPAAAAADATTAGDATGVDAGITASPRLAASIRC